MSKVFISAEFDNWYAESFLYNVEDPQTSSAAGFGARPGVQIMSFDPNNVVRVTASVVQIGVHLLKIL